MESVSFFVSLFSLIGPADGNFPLSNEFLASQVAIFEFSIFYFYTPSFFNKLGFVVLSCVVLV